MNNNIEVLQAYFKKPAAVRNVIREMIEIINDSKSSDIDRDLAISTINGVMNEKANN